MKGENSIRRREKWGTDKVEKKSSLEKTNKKTINKQKQSKLTNKI